MTISNTSAAHLITCLGVMLASVHTTTHAELINWTLSGTTLGGYESYLPPGKAFDLTYVIDTDQTGTYSQESNGKVMRFENAVRSIIFKLETGETAQRPSPMSLKVTDIGDTTGTSVYNLDATRQESDFLSLDNAIYFLYGQIMPSTNDVDVTPELTLTELSGRLASHQAMWPATKRVVVGLSSSCGAQYYCGWSDLSVQQFSVSSAVPETGTWAQMGLGLAAMAALVRRRKRA